MNKPQWFRVGPAETEAYCGPLLARMRPLVEGCRWYTMAVWRDGVWVHTTDASRGKLKKSFAEECERYELERDRARLDWLEAGGQLFFRVDMSNCNCGARMVGPIHWALTVRKAIDAAMQEEAVSAANVGGIDGG